MNSYNEIPAIWGSGHTLTNNTNGLCFEQLPQDLTFWGGAGVWETRSWTDDPGLCPEPEEEDPLKGLRRENWLNLERFDDYPS